MDEPGVGPHPLASSRRTVLLLILGFLLFALPDPADAQSPSYVGQWGVFGGEPGQFRYPRGVAVGPTGDVYVTDTENHRVQHFTAVGAFVKQWGQFGPEGSQFRSPYGIGVGSDGSVYVADTGNYLLKKFNDYGALVWSYGGFLNGFRTMACVGVAPSGVIHVSVPSGNLIRMVSPAGDYLGYVTTRYGAIDYPTGIAVNAAGDVFVAEQFKHRVTRLSAGGSLLLQWGVFGTANGQFQQPIGVAIDRAGLVHVLESAGNRVQVFTQDGTYVSQWGSAGAGAGQFHNPMGIAIAPSGDVYIADTENCRIQRFSQVPTPTTRSSWSRVKQLYR